jgi:hypothetical protein
MAFRFASLGLGPGVGHVYDSAAQFTFCTPSCMRSIQSILFFVHSTARRQYRCEHQRTTSDPAAFNS